MTWSLLAISRRHAIDDKNSHYAAYGRRDRVRSAAGKGAVGQREGCTYLSSITLIRG